MTTKTISMNVSMSVYDRVIQLGATLLDFHKYLNVKAFCSAFIETLVACASSCFPPIDMNEHIDDENISPDKKKGKLIYIIQDWTLTS